MKRIFIRFFLPAVLFALIFFSLTNKNISTAKADQDIPSSSIAKQFTLKDCYRLALQQSERVAIHQEMIKEAQARFSQSLGGILPHATFETTTKRQNGANSNNFSLSEIPEDKFIFSQPLFSGFKDFAGMGANRAERRQRTQETRRAGQLLFTDVSDAFYLFLSYQEDIAALEATQNALSGRIEELNKRVQLGRSRPSEVASAEVLLNRNEAELEGVRSQMEVSRQLLEFLTGERIEKVRDSQDGLSFGGGSSEISPEYTNLASHRADVLAAKEAWSAAQKKITVARAGWWPTAGLDGSYYTKRVGNSSDVTWDFTFKVDVPIFDGGETFGAVREAQALANQAQLSLQETQRSAVLEIQNAGTRFQTALKRRNALQKALRAAEKNYQLQKEDYQKSLVNNLDVLQSLQDLQSVRRDFIAARFDAKRMYWSLKVAVGEVPVE